MSGPSTAGLHPVMAEALAPLFAHPKPAIEQWSNWMMLDIAGKAMWVIYAPTREAALEAYPMAVDARPENGSPDDVALRERVRASYGTGGT